MDLYTKLNKAIAAGLSALIAILVVFGLKPGPLADPAVQTAVVGAIVGLVTYLVPNKVTPHDLTHDFEGNVLPDTAVPIVLHPPDQPPQFGEVGKQSG